MGLLGIEATCRIFHLAPGYAPLQVSTPWGEFIEYTYKSITYLPNPNSPEVNSDGFRDREFPSHFEGTRILMVGDSIVYGLCDPKIPLGFRTSELFEKTLKDSSQSSLFEVRNYGISGFNAEQEMDLLELKGLTLKPKYIIWIVSPNDHLPSLDSSWEFIHLAAMNDFAKSSIGFQSSISKALLHYSSFMRVLVNRNILNFNSTKSDTHGINSYEILTNGINHLLELQRKAGFTVIVALHPWLVDDPQPYKDQYVHYRELFNKTGWPVIDLEKTFNAKVGANLSQISCGDNIHPNEIGHQLISDAIADAWQHL